MSQSRLKKQIQNESDSLELKRLSEEFLFAEKMAKHMNAECMDSYKNGRLLEKLERQKTYIRTNERVY